MIPRPVHPYLGILEIAVFVAGSFFVIWILGPTMGKSPGLQVLLWIFSIVGAIFLLWFSPVFLHHNVPADWGMIFFESIDENPGSFKNAWPVYTIVTLFGAIILILYTIIFKSDALETINFKAVIIKFVGYLFYGTAQAVIFFGFILTRLREIVKNITRTDQHLLHRLTVVFLASVLFSAFHTPNLPLMACTFFTGFIWAWVFYQRPNILLMGLSHAVLGTVLHRIVQMHMRVGPFYENPELYIIREVIPGIRQLIGNLF